LEGGLFFGFLVAAGLTVISLSRPDYRIARRCAWTAAILFGSIAVVWGITTPESFWIRFLAVGAAGFVATTFLSEALRFVAAREVDSPITSHQKSLSSPTPSESAPVSPSVVSQSSPPNNPVFDLSGAKSTFVEGNKVIGNLNGRSAFRIQSSETTVVRNNEVMDQIPDPKAEKHSEYIGVSNTELRGMVAALSVELNNAEINFKNRTSELANRHAKGNDFVALQKEKSELFFQLFLPRCRTFQGEILSRLSQAGVTAVTFPDGPPLKRSSIMAGYRRIQLGDAAGADPFEATAEYLEFITGLMKS